MRALASFGTFCVDFVSTWELRAQHNRHLWTPKEARDYVLFTSVLPRTWLTGALSEGKICAPTEYVHIEGECCEECRLSSSESFIALGWGTQ